MKFISLAFFFVPGQIGAQESVSTLLFQSIGFPGTLGLTDGARTAGARWSLRPSRWL